MPLTLNAAPAAEPLDAAACRAQLRWTSTAEDTFFTGRLIPAARDRAEIATRRQFITATWDLLLDDFPGWEIELPKPPLVSVTHVKYVDPAGTLITLTPTTDYVYQAPAGPRCRRGRITPAYGASWPSVRSQVGAVQIRFVAGYGAAGTAVPPLLLQAMLLDIGGLWEFRENLTDGAAPIEIPLGAASIYRSFKSRPRCPLPEGID